MTKKTITIFLAAVLGIVLYGLLWPTSAQRVLSRVLKGVGITSPVHIPALLAHEASLRVVDPAAIAASLTKEAVSGIDALFYRDSKLSGKELVALDIIDETNKRRIEEGLAPLKVNERLVASAKTKTDDMVLQQYFEHESPSGDSVSDLGSAAGYSYIIMGENLALGNFDGAADLVQAWMDSPGHRANILNPLYQEIGVYAAKGTYEGREVWFAVQHFGTNRGACPVISRTLKDEIDFYNQALDSKQREIEALKAELEAKDAQDDPHYEEKITAFNELVHSYNDLLERSRDRIAEYNVQVSRFNTCLAKYQK